MLVWVYDVLSPSIDMEDDGSHGYAIYRFAAALAW